MDSRCRINLLGGLRIEQADRVITRFRSQQTGTLLAYLAYYRQRTHPREFLIELLWPECDPPVGRSRLSIALSSLRRQLEPPGVPTGAVIQADRASVGLNPAAIRTDVAEFEAALQAAESAGSSTERMQWLADAVECYRGPLLPGCYDEWILPEQQRLAEAFFHAIRQLVRHLEQTGDLSRALQYAARAVTADPLREEAHYELIRAYGAAGQSAAALRQFHELERILQAELGLAPSVTTRGLAREIEQRGSADLEGGIVPSAVPGRRGDELAPATSITDGERLGSLSSSPAHGSALPVSPPTGTVTFLLTDIAGSTALWERAGEGFNIALASHHALLRREFQRHDGCEVKEAGDSFVVAFAAAGEALACAVGGQRALAAHAWPEGVDQLNVRMVLHTGDVALKEREYRGLVLHHAARMLVAAHGGQILCSEVTAGLLRQAGPGAMEAGVQLKDLGVYRLRDVPSPARLFQVDYPDMRQRQFPPLHAAAGYAGNLPLHFTRFFGREAELAQLRELLLEQRTRLVTLTGPGGSGKTRLTLELAGQLAEAFQGAVWLAPLADLADPRLILDAVREALRLPRSPDVAPLEQVVEAFAAGPSLLVLDNFEHLVEEGAAVVRALLVRAPALQCVVTSRQRLDLEGEREFIVPPLATPTEGATPERLSLYESVQLFVDRAQAVRPDFQVTNANAPAVAELCHRLEGIPLAIELAAARVQLLTPMQMLAKLAGPHEAGNGAMGGGRFDFLVSWRRDAVARHRTLRAAIAWSYQLLSPELQRLFARLSVFRGGSDLEAVQAVCSEPGDPWAGNLLDGLEQLRECSLITRGEEEAAGMRFRMLETLREFAEEQLEPRERSALERRHAGYFLALAEQRSSVLKRLRPEVENFRVAFRWSIEQAPDLALRLAAALGPFWQAGGYFTEGREALARALERAGDSEAPGAAGVRKEALAWAGRLAENEGDFQQARGPFEAALVLTQQEGDPCSVAVALGAVGRNATWRGDYPQAQALLEEALAISREQGDESVISRCLADLGLLASSRGDTRRACSLLEESLALDRRLGNSVGITITLHNLGIIATEQGDYQTARSLLEESLARRREGSRQTGNEAGIHLSLIHLGWLALCQNDDAEASALFKEALVTSRRLGNKHLIVECLHGLAEVAGAQGQPERAARLFGASRALCEATGFAFWKTANPQIVSLREVLGEAAFATAWEAGQALTWQEAADYALEEQRRSS